MEKNKEEKVICYFHNDADGVMSASIVKKVYPNAKFIRVDYGHNWDVNDIIDSICIIVDFSFDDMDELKQYPDKLIWIDHHKTAMEKNQELWDSENIEGLRDLELSGCELTWTWFFPREVMPRVVELVGDRDMWKFKYGDKTRAFHEYVSIHFKEPSDYLLAANSKMIEEWIEIGKPLFEKKQDQIKKSFDQGIDMILNDHKTRVINSNMNVSETGEYCYLDKKYPMALIWSVRGHKIVVSLRSNTIDVGEIAKKRGGGGHKFAAGFEADWDFLHNFLYVVK